MKTEAFNDLYELSSDGTRAWLNNRKTGHCAARYSPHLLEVMGDGAPASYRSEKVDPGSAAWSRFVEMVKDGLGLDLPASIPS